MVYLCPLSELSMAWKARNIRASRMLSVLFCFLCSVILAHTSAQRVEVSFPKRISS